MRVCTFVARLNVKMNQTDHERYNNWIYCTFESILTESSLFLLCQYLNKMCCKSFLSISLLIQHRLFRKLVGVQKCLKEFIFVLKGDAIIRRRYFSNPAARLFFN